MSKTLWLWNYIWDDLYTFW